MNNPSQKIIAWLILFSGLLIIFLSIYYSYLMFTAKTGFPPVFKQAETAATQPAASKSADDPSLPKNTSPSSIGGIDMQALTQQAMNQAVTSMIPPDTVTKLLNIASWSFFSFFLVIAGSYISGIGIKLLSAKQPTS